MGVGVLFYQPRSLPPTSPDTARNGSHKRPNRCWPSHAMTARPPSLGSKCIELKRFLAGAPFALYAEFAGGARRSTRAFSSRPLCRSVHRPVRGGQAGTYTKPNEAYTKPTPAIPTHPPHLRLSAPIPSPDTARNGSHKRPNRWPSHAMAARLPTPTAALTRHNAMTRHATRHGTVLHPTPVEGEDRRSSHPSASALRLGGWGWRWGRREADICVAGKVLVARIVRPGEVPRPRLAVNGRL